jgi:hypothetical protein
MKIDQRRPLSDLDTELQTVGCRASNPNHCKNNSTEKKCAFVREDGLCLLPPKSWKKIFAELKAIGVEVHLDIHRTAKELIKQHGLKGASDYSADRIKRLIDFHDHDGVAVWRRIRAALLDVSDIRFEDDPVN